MLSVTCQGGAGVLRASDPDGGAVQLQGLGGDFLGKQEEGPECRRTADPTQGHRKLFDTRNSYDL